MMTMKNSFAKTLLAASIASISSASMAASFQLIEQSASGQGSAYAGAAALGEDASTIYFNPAGMTRLPGQQIVVAGHIVAPVAEFTNKGSTDALGGPLTGPESNTGDPAFVPNFYYSAELPNDTYVGVGVNVPFGLSTEYDDGWVGRYHALRSEIASVNINPSIAWKATDKVSIGFGVSIQYMTLELTNNLDSALVCNNISSNLPPAAKPGEPGCGTLSPNTPSLDSSSKLTGDSTEFGWNTGILIDVDENMRLGIAYRSAIKHKVSGDAEYNLDPTLKAETDYFKQITGFNIVQNTSLDANAELPDTLSLSFVSKVNDSWTALFDYTWTGWNKLDTIVIRQPGGVPGQEATLDLAYKNTSRYSIGVNYRHSPAWLFRGGLAYDETPIRSAENTSARIPGNDRTWLSLGLGWTPASSWSIDVAYTHLFIADTDINNSPGATASGATLSGEYQSKVDIFSVQGNFYF
ncbi:MAG TPA: hypothetical protein ENJ11_07675 [Gammaproteobacteria bacterium]|nr:hypothetical protein [Gammaproteobacteria bacterium]